MNVPGPLKAVVLVVVIGSLALLVEFNSVGSVSQRLGVHRDFSHWLVSKRSAHNSGVPNNETSHMNETNGAQVTEAKVPLHVDESQSAGMIQDNFSKNLSPARSKRNTLPPVSIENPLVVAYCTYVQRDRQYDPLGHSIFFSEFFGPHVFPGRKVEYRPCTALAKHLPKDVVPGSLEGLRLLGLTEDVDIRVCSFGATDIINTLTSVPGVGLVSVPVSEAQKRLKSLNLWWTDIPPGDVTKNEERWTHGGRIHWPRHSINIPMNLTTKKPFGPFMARHNKEPWFESVKGSPAQYDTKRTALSVDSITLYWPMLLDSLSWRLTGEKYPNHWSSRVGMPRLPASTIKEAVTRPPGYNASNARLSKRFFISSVHSHCGGPGSYLRSVSIRELFAFTVHRLSSKPVHFSGACPLQGRERGGKEHEDIRPLRRTQSAVDFMSHHKFSITFENSATSGYLTEKIMNAYLAESIPVYFGPPKTQIQNILNMKAFIHCDLPQETVSAENLNTLALKTCPSGDLKSNHECYSAFEASLDEELRPYFEKCAQEIIKVDQNATMYDQMLSEPLAKLDDESGDLKDLWDGREMGKVVRVAMAAFGYIEG